MHPTDPADRTVPGAWLWLGTIILAYIGIYLCRKNFSVAVPLLQEEWSLSKEGIGMVASISTICYAFGKVFLGPIVDRLGGRRGLLASMALVALFGALGAMAPTLLLLTVFYSANRLAGSAGWGAMVKLTPAWFSRRRLPLALGILSLSYVFGGALAVAFAGIIARLTADNWRMILGIPTLVLLVLTAGAALVLPRTSREPSATSASADSEDAFHWSQLPQLFRVRQLHVVCALSFTLTFLREIFNFWTVDYLKTEGGAELSIRAAAFLSIPFDLLGGLGILAVGWIYGRLSDSGRRRLVFGLLMVLSVTLLLLPTVARQGLWAAACVIGLVGFLVYGPYSLLAGVLAVEVRGRQYAATVAGLVDGTGYFAAVLSGVFFGRLLTLGGYNLGFQVMAILTLVSAVICLFLYRRPKEANAP